MRLRRYSVMVRDLRDDAGRVTSECDWHEESRCWTLLGARKKMFLNTQAIWSKDLVFIVYDSWRKEFV